MAASLMLRAPEGDTLTVDPSQYDVKAMLAKGWTRVGQVQVAAHTRGAPGTKAAAQPATQQSISDIFSGKQSAAAAGNAPDPSAGGMIASHAPTENATPQSLGLPAPPPHEPFAVSMIPAAAAIPGTVLGKAIGGGLGLAGGVAGAPETIGASVPLGVAAGQQVGGSVGGGLTASAGEILRQVIDEQLGNDYGLKAGPKEVGQQFLLNAAMGPLGEALSGGAKLLGRGAMSAAMRFTPEVAQTMLDEGITATKKGLEKLGQKLGQYGARTMAMVRQNPQTFDPTDILNGGGRALADELANNEVGTAGERFGVYKDLAEKFVREHSTAQQIGQVPGAVPVIQDMTAPQLHRFVSQADDIAEPIYQRIARNEPVSPTESATATWYKAMGDYARDVLRKTTPDMIDPATGKTMSYQQSQAQVSNLIRAKEALVGPAKGDVGLGGRIMRQAAPRTTGAAAGAAIGGYEGRNPQSALTGATVGAAMSSPQVLSVLAHLLNSPALAATLRQGPRLAAGAIGSQQ